MRLFYFLIFAICLNVQAKTITGKVTDTDNLALPGVNVIIKGTSTGTTTDMDGKYSIEAEEGDILIFSFIGFKTKKIKVEKKTEINVVMEADSSTLDEVIMVNESIAVSGYSPGIRIRGVASPQSPITANESY